MKKIIITAVLFMAVTTAFAQDTLSKPTISVEDRANLLNADQKNVIIAQFQQLQKTSQAFGYLLILDSLPTGQNLLNYTKGIFKKWELNTSNSGKNFVMVYSVKEHGVRIEASDILIQLLTKAYLQEVIDRSIKPYLKKRQDYLGLKRGIEMIALKIENN